MGSVRNHSRDDNRRVERVAILTQTYDANVLGLESTSECPQCVTNWPTAVARQSTWISHADEDVIGSLQSPTFVSIQRAVVMLLLLDETME